MKWNQSGKRVRSIKMRFDNDLRDVDDDTHANEISDNQF